MTAQFVWFLEISSRNGIMARDVACCRAPTTSGGSFFSRSGSLAYTDSTALPDSTCSASALGIQAENSLREFRGACANRVSSSASSPQMTSTSEAPAR